MTKKKTKKRISIALAGNPNCGKSTLFNHLSGSRQHVGNYPGVTVEKKEGKSSWGGYEMTFIDLPGTYSLSARSEDEAVACDFLLREKPDIVVHVLDASNLERNLYLYTQLAELDIPIVLALNMSDMADSMGLVVSYTELSEILGKPVVPTVGNKKKGITELVSAIVNVHEKKISIKKSRVDYGEDFKYEYEKILKLLSGKKDFLKEYPPEWVVIRLFERDSAVLEKVCLLSGADRILRQVEKSRYHLTQHFDDEVEVLIADRRYGFASGVCARAVNRTAEKRRNFSDRVDSVILNRFLGLPIFAAVMYGIFKFTFTYSEPVVGWFGSFFEWLSGLTRTLIPEGILQSFVVDGLIGGVGGVLGFFPLILFMFFAIAFFEDTGYMARAAFVMDRIMYRFGLHGRSFLPMMISTNGCAVPGIMASRTLDNKKDRLITMMVTPFMICGAKLPIFALFIGAFFPAAQGGNIMFLMYLLSIMIAFGSAWILKKTVFKGEASHLVMELPPYRMPSMKGLLLKMWERGWLYLKKAGTVIVAVSIIIWAGFSFPLMEPVEGMEEQAAAAAQMEQSFVGRAGKLVEPLVRPLGMDWRGGVALMAGIAAKEVVVSTFGTIYSLGEVGIEETGSLKESIQKDPFWNPLKAVAFLMFCLIYLPCFVAMAVFYRESGSSIKWTGFLIFWTSVMAWVAAFIVYQGGKLIGLGG